VVDLPQPEKIYDFVSWDDDIPNIWKNTSHVPNQQPGYHCNFHKPISVPYMFSMAGFFVVAHMEYTKKSKPPSSIGL